MLDLRIWTIDQSRSGSLSKLVVKLVTAECENLLLVQKFNCTLTWKIPGWSNRSWSIGRTWQQISCFPIFKKSTSADNVLQACVFVSWEEGTPFKGWKWSFYWSQIVLSCIWTQQHLFERRNFRTLFKYQLVPPVLQFYKQLGCVVVSRGFYCFIPSNNKEA